MTVSFPTRLVLSKTGARFDWAVYRNEDFLPISSLLCPGSDNEPSSDHFSRTHSVSSGSSALDSDGCCARQRCVNSDVECPFPSVRSPYQAAGSISNGARQQTLSDAGVGRRHHEARHLLGAPTVAAHWRLGARRRVWPALSRSLGGIESKHGRKMTLGLSRRFTEAATHVAILAVPLSLMCYLHAFL